MNASNPKKHHYVPECYLKSFGNFQKYFWRRKKEYTKVTISTPGQVCYEIDSNTIKTNEYILFNNLPDSYYIERNAFKKQENTYSKTLNLIVKFSNNPLVIDKSRYRLFIETIVCIKRRNPATREMLLKAFERGYDSPTVIQSFKKYINEVSVFVDERIDIENYIEEFLANRAKEPNRLHDMYLTTFLKKDDSTVIETMTDHFYQLKQHILHAPIGYEFITSDNPGFVVVNDSTLSIGGLGDDFEFYFPLTPNTCLYLNSKISESRNILEKTVYPKIIDFDHVFNINQRTKQVSNFKLFGRNKSILEQV